jgi:predicted nuclease of predicted toxin-antitoxin system
VRVITKDSDFVELIHRHGTPPQVVWITCGNASNAHLEAVLGAVFANALELLRAGETVVEIGDA